MEKKRIVVIPEYLNRSASRDEQHLKPLPAAKMFDNLRQAFEWSFQSELLGDYFGWHAPVYLVSGCKLILITKTTDKLIMEEEIFEALEGLKASYYTPMEVQQKIDIGPLYHDTDEYTFQFSERGYGRKKWKEMVKQKLNSLYDSTASDRDSMLLTEAEINSASAALQRRKGKHGNPEQE